MSLTYLEDNYNNATKTIDTNITSPIPSIMFFITITSIFSLLTIYGYYTNNELELIGKSNNVMILIYIGILLIGTYFINISISKTLCTTNEIAWNNVLFLTLLPWIIIFGLLYLLLELFPGWVRPFSNTIGYVIVNLLGAEKDIKNIFKKTDDTPKDKSPELIKALINIEKDYSRIINEFDINKDKFLSFFKQFKTENFLVDNIDNVDNIEKSEYVYKLYQHVVAKHFIGKIVWYILAGILIASITYNFLLDITCVKSSEEIEGQYNSLNSESSYVPIYGKKWKLVEDESEIENKTDATDTYNKLISKFESYFINHDDGIVELTYPTELSSVGIQGDIQYADTIYIVIGDDYFIPIE
tara:strand:- start:36 stop:1106 length:1071 start_codon:yes stop_codon:yes gene_type:complete